MKLSLWLLLGCAYLFISTGCTPINSAGNDNSAALRSVGTAPDETQDYQPPRSPGFDDLLKGR